MDLDFGAPGAEEALMEALGQKKAPPKKRDFPEGGEKAPPLPSWLCFWLFNGDL